MFYASYFNEPAVLQEIEGRLVYYIKLLSKWNRAYSLTSITDPLEMVRHHLFETLTLVPTMHELVARQAKGMCADLGSGMGVPGIPLAIMYPQWHFDLIDSVQRKAIFLNQVKIELALNNVRIISQRIETLIPKEPYDGFVARAFAPLAKMAQLIDPIAQPNTFLLAMKSKNWQHELSELNEQVPAWSLVEQKMTPVSGIHADRQLLLLVKADMTTHIFAVANQKGGVGKTTTAINLAAGLVKMGQRVLLIDSDPQGNATMGSGIEKASLKLSLYQVILGLVPISEVIVKSPTGGYDILPCNRELAAAETELVEEQGREGFLRKAIEPVKDHYDFILIDCAPALSLLPINGLSCANGVIVPMQCEYFALEGLSDLINTIKQVRTHFNHHLKIVGLLRVMFDTRTTLQQQVSEQLEAHFGDKVFQTVIPRNVRLAESPSHGMPCINYDAASKGSQAYLAFAQEMILRIKGPDYLAEKE
ncbi:unnamed protein product [Darwinula stevensoni]|uniref:AAA domain-containing protein n=1 Tax=Darwinula stevensoni TaxID=69355 RepID=A0A7R9A9S0_9CRUS|nr:unnamed protein product [Darwinula stevensoni]CAG0897668.1 unnamed protein product [Darwinula stevensoni]